MSGTFFAAPKKVPDTFFGPALDGEQALAGEIDAARGVLARIAEVQARLSQAKQEA